jgi:hypothetical protein
MIDSSEARTISMFMRDRMRYSYRATPVRLNDIWKCYLSWCRDNNFRRMSQANFVRIIDIATYRYIPENEYPYTLFKTDEEGDEYDRVHLYYPIAVASYNDAVEKYNKLLSDKEELEKKYKELGDGFCDYIILRANSHERR